MRFCIMPAPRALGVLVCALVLGCDASEPEHNPVSVRHDVVATSAVPTPSPGCGLPQPGGVQTRHITVNGVERSYLIAMPNPSNPSTPLALVFGWHGSTGTSANAHIANTGLEVAAAGAALFVYPQGLPILGYDGTRCSIVLDIPSNAGGPAFTSAVPGQNCVGWDWRPNGRDVALFDALMDSSNPASVTANYCIDTSRVYALGFSSGGFMTQTLACTRSALLKAAVVESGGLGPWIFPSRSFPGAGCTELMFAGAHPPRGTDVTAANPPPGCDDPTVPILFIGNRSGADGPYNACTIAPGQARDVALASHGCSVTTTPVAIAADSIQSRCDLYTSCAQSNVYSCSFLNTQGHAPPPPLSALPSTIWRFFAGTL